MVLEQLVVDKTGHNHPVILFNPVNHSCYSMQIIQNHKEKEITEMKLRESILRLGTISTNSSSAINSTWEAKEK